MDWCTALFGPLRLKKESSREHPGQRASIFHLQIPSVTGGKAVLKLHRNRTHWECEVHAYEQWAGAFGVSAPNLLAVREEEPLALVISEIPGKVLEEVELSVSRQGDVWHQAGQALAALHNLTEGEYFGPCRRDGSCSETFFTDAVAYVRASFDEWMERGAGIHCLADEEMGVIEAMRQLIPSFTGELPLACHRDYCPANWLVSPGGTWIGVIDFEFSYWDVRSADFSRFPGWEWIEKPHLMEAFYDGYGRTFTPAEEAQNHVSHALYALTAIVWGAENGYHGFAREGRKALQHIGKMQSC
jgi:8-oxo-dGTP diphosphatase